MRLCPLLPAVFSLCALAPAAVSAAQDERPASVAPEFDVMGESGPVFSSVEAGFSVQLPPGELKQPSIASGEAELLATVTNEAEDYRFEVRVVRLDRPMPILGVEMPEGGRRTGYLELLAGEIDREATGNIIRASKTPLADADAGVLVARYRVGGTSFLRQEAIVRVDDRTYHKLLMISPAPGGPVDEIGDDARVRRAVSAFTASLDSYRAIDQTALLEEQEQRLLRTRSLLVNLKVRGRLAEACAGEALWRIRRGGRDVGFAHVIEEPANRLPDDINGGFTPADRQDGTADAVSAEGVRVGMLVRMQTPGGIVSRRSWHYASRQLDTSDFRETNNLLRDDGEDELAGADAAAYIVGQMRSGVFPVRYEVPAPGPLEKETIFDLETQRRLEVIFTLNQPNAREVADRRLTISEPVERDLTPWFLPGAVDHLLPRVAAEYGQRTYAIAVWVPSRREVMMKYVDVAAPAEVELPGGRGTREAIVVSTRIGLNGVATDHFIDADTFAWLGTSGGEADTEVWPATPDEIAEVWKGTTMLPDVPQ